MSELADPCDFPPVNFFKRFTSFFIRRTSRSRRFLAFYFFLLCALCGIEERVDGQIIKGFLQIPGVEGESTDSAHEKWIEIESFSEFLNSRSSTNPVAGSVSLTKQLDKSSPYLAFHVAKVTHHNVIKLDLQRSTPTRQVFYSLELSEAVLVGLQMSSTGTRSPIYELVKVSFDSMRWRSVEFDRVRGSPTNEIVFSWNLINGDTSLEHHPLNSFVIHGSFGPNGRASLNWVGAPGKQYRILSAPKLDLPFSLVGSTTAPAIGGQVSFLAPPLLFPQFFRVEENP